MSFRYKKGIKAGYNEQGWIYFHCIRFSRLPQKEREQIKKVCREAGGEHADALLEFVTTERGYTAVCLKHHISQATLYRLVKKFYEGFLR